MLGKTRVVVLSATVIYAVALSVFWYYADTRADERIEALLVSAEKIYSDDIDGELDAALHYVAGALFNILGRRCEPQPQERLQSLAETLNVDEINIVNAKGRVIASNLPVSLGADFNESPVTREYMALTNAAVTFVSQPFRDGVSNPDTVSKYLGVAYPGHDGFLQLGLTVDRLRQRIYAYTRAEADQILKDWHFSAEGWYERASDDPGFEPGRIFRRWDAGRGEWIVGRYFGYRGYRYVALLPKNYCYQSRNWSFAMTSLLLGLVLVVFVCVLVRLVRMSEKLERAHAEVAARNEADLALARTIQMSALPPAEGAFSERLEMSLSAECRPAREVGGDFYDFFHLPDGRLAFLIADVSGKGIPAALFMMEAKNVIRSSLLTVPDLAEAVAEANGLLCAGNKAEMFVTAWIGALDREGTFDYVNAGHNRPFVRRADGTVEKVTGKGGRFLGMFEGVAYRVNRLRLNPGDALYLYTDGVTEAMNMRNEPFGEERLQKELGGGIWRIREAVEAFTAGAQRSDDMTDMTIFWNGKPEMRACTFPAVEASLASMQSFLREALSGCSGRTVAAMLNAADEIAANVVAYSGASTCRLEVERTVKNVRLRVFDDGKAYNPLTHVDPDTHVSLEERPLGGLGLVVVKRLVDRVSYAREDGWNTLTLVQGC